MQIGVNSMPDDSLKVGMFTFFVVGAFGGWLYLAVAIYEWYQDWKYARALAAYEKFKRSQEEPGEKKVTYVTNLTRRTII
jgi:hypothetical protein